MTVSLAPFVPSQPKVVTRMLELADVHADDVVYDLGCGDGRIIIAAVKEFGAKKAVGYEMRRDLYQRNLEKIKSQALEGRVTVYHDNAFNADLAEATIITLYLTTSGNNRLKPKLSEEAKPGTRIVSHDFDFTGWTHTKKESFGGHTIYLYTIPDCFQKPDKTRPFFSFKRRPFFK